VLLSGLFVLDLLVIYPFADSNGRVARLLTSATLSEHGYTVGLYVSLGQPVAESADAVSQTSGRQYQVSATRPSGSSGAAKKRRQGLG
jgi:Fic family protein